MSTNGGPRDSGGAVHRLLSRAVDIRPDEVRAVLTSAAFFFFLLSSYFVLRPIRDAVAAASGATKLSWLFTATMISTLSLNPFFSALVVRFPIRRVIPISYQFFAANLVVFYVVLRFVSAGEGSTADVWTGRVFFVWTTVFALFNTSIFWCLMADSFSSEQGKRLFAFIGVGGTIGSIIGSAVTAALARQIGAVNVLLVSAVLIELAIFTVVKFPLQSRHASPEPAKRRGDEDVIGGSVWAGFSAVAKSPYLIGICVFMVLYTIGSTFLYFEQADIVGRYYASTTARTAILAQLELAAQVLTILTQIFLTGRLIRWIGLPLALAWLPVVSILGFGSLAMVPTFVTLSVFTVARRGSNFAITNPAMEVLFTVVPREDKYKAKNIIETFVYRGGDQVGAWAYSGLVWMGLSLAGISYVAVPLAAIWLVLGIWLGRRQAVLAVGDRQAPSPVPPPPPSAPSPPAPPPSAPIAATT